MNIWCLHGNLQRPTVWHPFENSWTWQDKPLPLKCPNLWRSSAEDFSSWTDHFCNTVAEAAANQPQWLLGYSLGGRLALHAAIARPNLWAGVIVVGAHPGFKAKAEQSKQLAWDTAWAKRFRHEPWEMLLQEWDRLPVFGGIPNPVARETKDFDRNKVADTFTRFSKGRQSDLSPALAALKTPPVLFISGEQDARYNAIGRTLRENCPMVQHEIVPHACHRVPWENTQAFVKIIQVFLDQTPYNKQ